MKIYKVVGEILFILIISLVFASCSKSYQAGDVESSPLVLERIEPSQKLENTLKRPTYITWGRSSYQSEIRFIYGVLTRIVKERGYYFIFEDGFMFENRDIWVLPQNIRINGEYRLWLNPISGHLSGNKILDWKLKGLPLTINNKGGKDISEEQAKTFLKEWFIEAIE